MLSYFYSVSSSIKPSTMMRYSLIILVSISCSGCLMQWDYCQREINDYFSISWVDLPHQQGISFSENTNSNIRSVIIGPYVYAVGNNENFIIVKQHPGTGDCYDSLDVNTTNYYIIEKINLIKNEDYIIHGPLDESKFDSTKKVLKIIELEFTTIFPHNPDNYRAMSDY